MIFSRCVVFPSILLLGSCFSSTDHIHLGPGKFESPPLRHLVLCWLKEPGNGDHQEKIIEVTKSFREIPGVLDAQAGKSVPSDRSIVDDSFDVGILVVLESMEALDEYLRHPLHDDAKKKILLPLVDRLVVYDFQE